MLPVSEVASGSECFWSFPLLAVAEASVERARFSLANTEASQSPQTIPTGVAGHRTAVREGHCPEAHFSRRWSVGWTCGVGWQQTGKGFPWLPQGGFWACSVPRQQASPPTLSRQHGRGLALPCPTALLQALVKVSVASSTWRWERERVSLMGNRRQLLEGSMGQ